jgi:hypothetical protein
MLSFRRRFAALKNQGSPFHGPRRQRTNHYIQIYSCIEAHEDNCAVMPLTSHRPLTPGTPGFHKKRKQAKPGIGGAGNAHPQSILPLPVEKPDSNNVLFEWKRLN